MRHDDDIDDDDHDDEDDDDKFNYNDATFLYTIH